MEFHLEFLLYWAKLVVPCWRAFLVEHRRWIIHLMEFQLEFLLDHMLVILFWYVLVVESSSRNLHEGTLVLIITLILKTTRPPQVVALQTLKGPLSGHLKRRALRAKCS